MRKALAFVLTFVLMFATRALAQGPHVIEAAPRIMVLPFTPVGDPGAYGWVGTGIQQSLLAEVNRPGTIAWTVPAPAAPSTQPSVTTLSPITQARRAQATVAVFGSYQIVGDQIRTTGQMVDVSTGQSLASLKATGSLHELFKMEDTLDNQLQSGLPQPPQIVQPVQATAPQPQQETDASFSDETNPAAAEPYVCENDNGNIGYAQTYALPYPYTYYSNYGFAPGFVFFGSDRHGVFGRGSFNPRFHHGLSAPVFGHPVSGLGFHGSFGGFGGHAGFGGSPGFGSHGSFGGGGHIGFGGGHR